MRARSIPEKSNSNLWRGSLLTRSLRRDLSKEMTCETFATESFGNPVTRADRLTLPGASAHFKLLVKRNANGCRDAALIEGIALNNNHGSPKPRPGAGGCWQVRPPNLTLRDHHSVRSSLRRATEETNSSLPSPTSIIA